MFIGKQWCHTVFYRAGGGSGAATIGSGPKKIINTNFDFITYGFNIYIHILFASPFSLF